MIFLPDGFTLDRYGLNVRFVNEADAQFILAIRSDLKNKRFIHDTDDALNAQIEYLRAYKEKEKLGREYYLLFEYNGLPQGVYRIYNINSDWCTTGSWVFSRFAEKTSAFKALIITHEIVFENLGYTIMKDVDGIHESNIGVINAVKTVGAQFGPARLDAKGTYLTFSIAKTDFYERRKNALRYVGVNCINI